MNYSMSYSAFKKNDTLKTYSLNTLTRDVTIEFEKKIADINQKSTIIHNQWTYHNWQLAFDFIQKSKTYFDCNHSL